jgi:hypothetical protein
MDQLLKPGLVGMMWPGRLQISKDTALGSAGAASALHDRPPMLHCNISLATPNRPY